MRINLNFKDATITQLNNPGCEYKIEFDLSKIPKPRLSQDARMYIENMNMPEFVDEVLGKNNGEVRGYFELRCENIDNSYSFDTDEDKTGGSIIYTSPLTSFQEFRNNDPMHVSNFKINQGFLKDKFVLRMKIYDQFGEPYTTAENLHEDIDVDSGEYGNYKTSITKLDKLNQEYANVDSVVAIYKTRRDIAIRKQAHCNTQFKRKLTAMIDSIDAYLKGVGARSTRIRLRSEEIKLLFSMYSINLFSYLFERYLPSLSTQAPVREPSVQDAIDELRQAWVELVQTQFEVLQTKTTVSELVGSNAIIWYGTTSEFSDKTLPVKSKSINTPYTVTVAGGTDKTGTLDLDVFTSVKETVAAFVVSNITPSDSTVDHELTQNDILTIPDTAFEEVTPQEFTYYFYKGADDVPTGVTLSGTGTQNKKKRFAIKVTRTAANYDYEIMNSDIQAISFKDADTITIDGSVLGGTTPTENLTITITNVITYPNTETHTFTHTTPNGNIPYEIERDNVAGTYSVTTEDYTATHDYNKGDKIVIPGTLMDGVSPANDLTLDVDAVIVAEQVFQIDHNALTHSIPATVINNTNSTVQDSGGSAKPGVSGYQVKVYSTNGTYEILFDPATDSSTGFAQNDKIVIDGTALSGETGVNNLILDVLSVDGSGKILTIAKETSGTYVARYPYNLTNPFEFEVKIKANQNTYDVVNKSGTGFQPNDYIVITGDKLNGDAALNKLEFYIDLVDTDASGITTIKSLKTITGTPADNMGNIGQILRTSIDKGAAIKKKNIGSFEKANTSKTGTPIDVTTYVTPELEIELGNDSVRGIGLINSDIDIQRADVQAKKNALIPVRKRWFTSFGDLQRQKMKCMNMSLVLYDEIPEYTQASQDAIKGNTYSRIQNCQFKRI